MEGGDFRLEAQGGRLIFRTSSFEARMGSVLSPVVYSHELSAMLAAALPAAAAFLLLGGAGLWRYPALVAAYAAGFFFFRLLVFKKRSLTLEADGNTGEIILKLPFRGAKKFRAEEVERVEARHTTITTGNPDGLRQVEKIALHHHTVLPELDKPMDFHTVRLHLKGGRPLDIYSGHNSKDAAELVVEIRKFLSPETGGEDA